MCPWVGGAGKHLPLKKAASAAFILSVGGAGALTTPRPYRAGGLGPCTLFTPEEEYRGCLCIYELSGGSNVGPPCVAVTPIWVSIFAADISSPLLPFEYCGLRSSHGWRFQ